MKGYKLRVVGWSLVIASLWALISVVIVQGNRILRAMPASTYGETQDVHVVNGSDDRVPVELPEQLSPQEEIDQAAERARLDQQLSKWPTSSPASGSS